VGDAAAALPGLHRPPPPEVVVQRLADVRRRIERAGRDPDGVRVVAVTKTFDADAVRAAVAAGLEDIGENYAGELLAKAAALAGPVAAGPAPPVARHGPGLRWHYLGAIQRRRVRDLAPVVSWWQTVSRAVEGEAIARRAPGATVLVEVDTTGIAGRYGCPSEAVAALVSSLRALGLDVRGLMTVAPPGPAEQARPGFRLVATLARELGLDELSMGMTGDLEVALAEGATTVRVGRALFGARAADQG